MDNKFFGIAESARTTTDGTGGDAIPVAKRATGFTREQPFFEYINQALFELKTDHIIGTAAQLTLGQCTCKYQSSDQTLRDSSGTAVTLTDGDRVYIIGLDTLTADFDLSAYDRLRVVSDPSIELANGTWNLEFGDNCFLEIVVADSGNIVSGSLCYGFVNHLVYGVRFTECHYTTVNGYGSTNTKFQKFSTVTVASNDDVVTVTNSGVTGFQATANMDCIAAMVYSATFAVAGYFGIARNGSGTVNITSQVVGARVAVMYAPTANQAFTVSWVGKLTTGSVLAPNANGALDGSTPSWAGVRIMAIEII